MAGHAELTPYERIRYTDVFDDPNLPGEMHVTITLKQVSCGTEMTAVQEGIPEVIPAEACYLGWQESLTLLTKLVEAEIPTRYHASGGRSSDGTSRICIESTRCCASTSEMMTTLSPARNCSRSFRMRNAVWAIFSGSELKSILNGKTPRFQQHRPAGLAHVGKGIDVGGKRDGNSRRDQP